MRLILLTLLLLTSAVQARDLVHNVTGIEAGHIGGDFTLTGPGDKAVSLSDFQGKVVLLYFGYTSCPDVCPMSLSVMKRTMSLLGEQQKQVQGIFVTFDPNRDGGKQLQQYVTYFHPDFIGLEGGEVETAKAALKWKVVYMRQESDSAAGYLMAHTDYIYLIDQNGELAGLYNSASEPQTVADGIRIVLAEN